jgi:tetratricopeptide (TPR) repeat protein
MLNREIGNLLGAGHALMFCGQIEAIYLGDAQSGLTLMREALSLWEGTPDKLFPLLRIAQIQTMVGEYEQAWQTLAQARAASERVILDIGHAGLRLVEAILHNTRGGAEHWREALALQAQVRQMVAQDQLSRQYQMAAACAAAAAHLGLAGCLGDAAERAEHRQQALAASQTALEIYQRFGFTQVVECLGEEILYRHSLALAANEKHSEARDFLERAYAEMMRKHDLIPADSPFRKTFLENVAVHQQIRAARLAAADKGTG